MMQIKVTVSYTHLDVYKRQPIGYSPLKHAVQKPQPLHSTARKIPSILK